VLNAIFRAVRVSAWPLVSSSAVREDLLDCAFGSIGFCFSFLEKKVLVRPC
jgi:hypothetical protein